MFTKIVLFPYRLVTFPGYLFWLGIEGVSDLFIVNNKLVAKYIGNVLFYGVIFTPLMMFELRHYPMHQSRLDAFVVVSCVISGLCILSVPMIILLHWVYVHFHKKKG